LKPDDFGGNGSYATFPCSWGKDTWAEASLCVHQLDAEGVLAALHTLKIKIAKEGLDPLPALERCIDLLTLKLHSVWRARELFAYCPTEGCVNSGGFKVPHQNHVWCNVCDRVFCRKCSEPHNEDTPCSRDANMRRATRGMRESEATEFVESLGMTHQVCLCGVGYEKVPNTCDKIDCAVCHMRTCFRCGEELSSEFDYVESHLMVTHSRVFPPLNTTQSYVCRHSVQRICRTALDSGYMPEHEWALMCLLHQTRYTLDFSEEEMNQLRTLLPKEEH
jgi:hypothetical protein